MPMSTTQHEISQETFDAVARKLEEFAEGLPQEEQDLVRALLRLTGEQLDEVATSDVSGYSSAKFGVELPDPSGFRAGFEQSFGPLTGGPDPSGIAVGIRPEHLTSGRRVPFGVIGPES
jgi:hypothetical protein